MSRIKDQEGIPTARVLDRDLSSDAFSEKPSTLITTEVVVHRIKAACNLVVNSITAIDDSGKFQNSSLPLVRSVHRAQFVRFLKQLDLDDMTIRKMKSELNRKIEIIKEAISLHTKSFFKRDLERALRMLEKALGGL
jgi:hypothetical protein